MFRSRSRQRAKTKEYLAAAAIGVIRVMSASSSHERALSGSGARGPGWAHQFQHQSNVAGPAVDGGRVEGRAHGRRRGSSRFRRCGAALGVVRPSVPSRTFRFREGSLARPYNIALEPSRPTVGCYSVAAARGSARAVIPTRKPRLRNARHRGCCEVWFGSGRLAASGCEGYSRCRAHLNDSDLGRGN